MDMKSRENLARQLLAQSITLLQKAQKLPFATARIQYFEKIQQELSLVEPFLITDEQEYCPENDPLRGKIRLYIIHPSDSKLGACWKYCCDRIDHAAYGAYNHMILINSGTLETRPFLSLALIHEVGHAQFAEEEGRVNKKEPRFDHERIAEELKNWEYDKALVWTLGGKPLRTVAEKVIKQMHHRLWQRFNKSRDAGAGRALSPVFGPPPPALRHSRDLTFWIYCALAACDRFEEDEVTARMCKLAIMRSLHAEEFHREKRLILEARQT